jgi:predicted acetyltransferase
MDGPNNDVSLPNRSKMSKILGIKGLPVSLLIPASRDLYHKKGVVSLGNGLNSRVSFCSLLHSGPLKTGLWNQTLDYSS